jgi:hypothetical protein
LQNNKIENLKSFTGRVIIILLHYILIEKGKFMSQDEFTVNETESREHLQRLKTEVFDSDDEKVAFAMGRPVEEIIDWLSGGEIDDDGQMKINGIAKERLSE